MFLSSPTITSSRSMHTGPKTETHTYMATGGWGACASGRSECRPRGVSLHRVSLSSKTLRFPRFATLSMILAKMRGTSITCGRTRLLQDLNRRCHATLFLLHHPCMPRSSTTSSSVVGMYSCALQVALRDIPCEDQGCSQTVRDPRNFSNVTISPVVCGPTLMIQNVHFWCFFMHDETKRCLTYLYTQFCGSVARTSNSSIIYATKT